MNHATDPSRSFDPSLFPHPTSRRGRPIMLRSGHPWWPFSPLPGDVRSADFPTLARIPRWGGNTTVPYDVAEHSVRVALLLRDWGCPTAIQLQGHTHDLHEIYPPHDVEGPVLRSEDCPEAAALKWMELQARDAVRAALGLPSEFDDVVHEADMVLQATERRDLMPPGMADHFQGLPEPLEERIEPWGWELSWARWHALWVELGGRVLAEAT